MAPTWSPCVEDSSQAQARHGLTHRSQGLEGRSQNQESEKAIQRVCSLGRGGSLKHTQRGIRSMTGWSILRGLHPHQGPAWEGQWAAAGGQGLPGRSSGVVASTLRAPAPTVQARRADGLLPCCVSVWLTQGRSPDQHAGKTRLCPAGCGHNSLEGLFIALERQEDAPTSLCPITKRGAARPWCAVPGADQPTQS